MLGLVWFEFLFPFLKERVIVAKMPATDAKLLLVPFNQKIAHPYPIKEQEYVLRMVVQGVIKFEEFDSGVSLIKLIMPN